MEKYEYSYFPYQQSHPSRTLEEYRHEMTTPTRMATVISTPAVLQERLTIQPHPDLRLIPSGETSLHPSRSAATSLLMTRPHTGVPASGQKNESHAHATTPYAAPSTIPSHKPPIPLQQRLNATTTTLLPSPRTTAKKHDSGAFLSTMSHYHPSTILPI